MLNLKIILITFLLFPLWSAAAESESTADQRPANQIKAEQQKENKIEVKNETELPKSTGKTLKEKKLSNAFEQFIPSEKISADNAVPFPVDI